MSDLYRQEILEELKNPRGVGKLSDPSATHQGHNASCGDDLTVYVNLSADQKTLEEIKWHGTGCAISQVSMSQVVANLEGQPVDQVLAATPDDVLEWLGLSDINPGRRKCLSLGLLAVQQALEKISNSQ